MQHAGHFRWRPPHARRDLVHCRTTLGGYADLFLSARHLEQLLSLSAFRAVPGRDHLLRAALELVSRARDGRATLVRFDACGAPAILARRSPSIKSSFVGS